MSYFNSEQIGEMARLIKADPKTLCLCGWWDHGKCDTCPPQFTHADRLAEKCVECGGYPERPGGRVGHNIACSQYTRQQQKDANHERECEIAAMAVLRERSRSAK